MKIRSVVSLLLVGAMLLALCACGGGNPSTGTTDPNSQQPTATTPGSDDPLDKLNFNGETLVVSVSANQDTEVTFDAANKYISGPDKIGKDDVHNMVYNRNRNVAHALNINVEYRMTDLSYDKVQPDLEKLHNDPDAPDIYNNDIFGLLRAMFQNYLYNVADPGLDENGKPVESYFDFSHESWYFDYMKGATLFEEKMYLLAGDYFLDIIRMAWVLYINAPAFNETFSADFYDLDGLYEEVSAGNWDYDTLAFFTETGFRDTGKVGGKADEDDSMIGIIFCGCGDRIFNWTNGLSAIEWKNGLPVFMEQCPEIFRFSEGFSRLYNQNSSLIVTDNLSPVTLFLDGNVLFTMAALGELESPAVRDADFSKGLVPYPKYDLARQEHYHTLVHDQAEIGAILNTTRNFTMASAFLQMINVESVPVLQEYYENTLKFKYSDFRTTREMIDLVHDTIDSPFESLVVAYVQGLTGEHMFRLVSYDAKEKTTQITSSYESYRPQWQAELDKLILIYEDILQ